MKFDKKSGYYYKERIISSRKYLLINPPVIDTIELNKHNYFDPGPIGLLRVANYLYSHGNHIKFFDFDPVIERKVKWTDVRVSFFRKKLLYYFGKSFEEMVQELSNVEPPDEIFVASYMTFSCGAFPKLFKILKGLFPDAKIILGGTVANLLPQEMKKIGFEVHIGSFEEADSFYPLYEIMEKLPKFSTLRLTKGCPKNCSYCAVPFLEGKKIKNFGFERLKKEFDHSLNLGFKRFIFWDANILYAKKDLWKFLDYLARKKPDAKVDLHYGIDFEYLDNHTFDKIDKANIVKYIVVPLESSVKKIYGERFHKRKDHLEIIDKKIKELKKRGYHVGFYVIAGMPDQTIEGVLETLLFGLIRGCEPYIMPFTLIPGTEEYEKYKPLLKGKTLEETNPNLFPFSSKFKFKHFQDIYDIFHNTFLCKNNRGHYFLYKHLEKRVINLKSRKKVLKLFRKMLYLSEVFQK